MTSYTTFEVKHATQSLIFILCMNAHMQSILMFLQVCVQDDMEMMNAKDKCRYINFHIKDWRHCWVYFVQIGNVNLQVFFCLVCALEMFLIMWWDMSNRYSRFQNSAKIQMELLNIKVNVPFFCPETEIRVWCCTAMKCLGMRLELQNARPGCVCLLTLVQPIFGSNSHFCDIFYESISFSAYRREAHAWHKEMEQNYYCNHQKEVPKMWDIQRPDW